MSSNWKSGRERSGRIPGTGWIPETPYLSPTEAGFVCDPRNSSTRIATVNVECRKDRCWRMRNSYGFQNCPAADRFGRGYSLNEGPQEWAQRAISAGIPAYGMADERAASE
jgi:hypothetical protein